MNAGFIHIASPRAVPTDWWEKNGPCCYESANTDGESCSCWLAILYPLPEVDKTGKPVAEEGPPDLRRRMCSDCAFKPGSPERQSLEHGEQLPYGPDKPFTCHSVPGGHPDNGGVMPKVTVWVHPPSGATIPVTEDDYKPIIHGDRAWLADGSPAPRCAGWGRINRIRS